MLASIVGQKCGMLDFHSIYEYSGGMAADIDEKKFAVLWYATVCLINVNFLP